MTANPGYTTQRRLYIGCAGWNLSRSQVPDVGEGTQLTKYASVFRSVEINSSFHRPHRQATYERWANSVPQSFRFSVKCPKSITHEKRLVDCADLTAKFLDEVAGLGDKLGAILVQLPPSLELDVDSARVFFEWMRSRYSGDVFIEPRHRTWFSPAATKLMYDVRVGRVAADPAVVPAAAEPGGMTGHVYFRLHGSPQIYFSSYTTSYLDGLAFRLRMHARAGDTVWCIFDNTIRGAAASNALCVARKVELGERAASVR
ncbi:MAG TPA: DUF72 domain-containing protein [Gemmatimonadaceae bacterium]